MQVATGAPSGILVDGIQVSKEDVFASMVHFFQLPEDELADLIGNTPPMRASITALVPLLPTTALTIRFPESILSCGFVC